MENWLTSGKSGRQIAGELGISYPSLKEWKRRYDGDAMPRRDDPAAEIRALKAELARVREQRDILKKRWASSAPRRRLLPDHRAHERRPFLGRPLRRLRREALRLPRLGPGRSRPPRAGDAELLPKIRALHGAHRRLYGAPRIQKELAAQGARHGVKRIARLMKENGLRGLGPKRYVPRTTDSRHDRPIAEHRLAQAPTPTGPDQIWVADLTYIPTQEGWLYAAVVMDRWSRRVVGWATGDTLHASLAVRALRMALQHRRPPAGLLHHSDRGVQYASADYRAQLGAHGIQASMSRCGNPYDNAAMESFMATYKRESVGLAEKAGGHATRAAAAAELFAYIETYYNRRRLHSTLGYQTPVDFELQLN